MAGSDEQQIATVKNPRNVAILERCRAVIADTLRAHDLKNQMTDDWGEEKTDPLEGFLSAVAFAMRATYSTSLGTSPGALVFRRDMFFPTKHVANWKLLQDERSSQMLKGSENENKKRLPHKCKVNDLVLIRHDMDGEIVPGRELDCPTSGPYRMLRVRNSTIEIERHGHSEKINIRRLQPHHARP